MTQFHRDDESAGLLMREDYVRQGLPSQDYTYDYSRSANNTQQQDPHTHWSNYQKTYVTCHNLNC